LGRSTCHSTESLHPLCRSPALLWDADNLHCNSSIAQARRSGGVGQLAQPWITRWLICRACHQELNNDPHLTWYYRLRMWFRRYQAAAEAYTMAFRQRTPARMHAGKRRLVP
jgi:hypothetical protein